MKLVSLENITKYNELLNQKMVKSVNSVKPDVNGNVSLGTEKSTFNKVTFDTDYFSVATDSTYSFDLTGTDLELIDKEKIQVRIVAKVTTANSNFEEGDIAELALGVDHSVSDELDVCAYIRGNLLYVYSGSSQYLSIRNSTGWLRKDYAQIKVILTAFVPDDGTIQLIATDSTGTTELVGTPSGTLTWNSQNIVRSVNGVNADENGNVTISSLIPNQIIQSPVPLTDANLHLLDGALLSGDGAYADYVAMMGELYNADPTATCWTTESDWQTSVSTYGECGKFVYDSESNTLRLPKLASFVQATNSANELGSLVEAGLPNITGQLYPTTLNEQGSDGYILTCSAYGAFSPALSKYNVFKIPTPEYVPDKDAGVDFNASRSNPIYGKSTTVQPQAIKYYFYIVVGTLSKTDIQVNIDNVMTDLNGKADKDLSNVSGIVRSVNGVNADTSGNVTITSVANATKATQDKNGAQIDTTYFKSANGVFTGTEFIRNVDNSSLKFYGGTSWTRSASISLTGNKDDNPCTVDLFCHNPTSEVIGDFNSLHLQYQKIPTWNGNPIEVVNSVGNNYIRYSSGLTLIWGGFSLPAGTKRQTVNLPIPFKSNYQVFLSNMGNDKDYGANIGYQVVKKSLSAFDIQHSWEGGTGWYYFAVGY